jgi:hypothetical protein
MKEVFLPFPSLLIPFLLLVPDGRLQAVTVTVTVTVTVIVTVIDFTTEIVVI